MKLFVDIDRAVADGTLTAEQGERLRRAATVDTVSLAINALLSLGVLAITGGALALKPMEAAIFGLAAVLVAAGLWLLSASRQWSLLGAACLLTGALTASGQVLRSLGQDPAAFGIACAILLTLGVVARNRLLVALAVFAAAGSIGSLRGDFDVRWSQASLTIVCFAVLGLAAHALARRVPRSYAGLAETFAVSSFVWVNLGFLVGSLLGDRPLLTVIVGHNAAWDQIQAWPFIPPLAFAIVWSLGLLGTGAWAARQGRRAVVNAAATFGAVDFFSQWFARLSLTPAASISAGLIAIGMALALWRYNRAATEAA